MELAGNLVDVEARDIYPARVSVEGNRISEVEPVGGEFERYLVPGLIDAHIHIESSMLCPSRFAEVVVPKGTACVIADPHEIANVMGVKGIVYMMDDSKGVPLKVYFTAPSCVPATPFETAGATLGPEEMDAILAMDGVVALGEMMNYPGVVGRDAVVMEKLEAAKRRCKRVDGHAPMLSGEELRRYVEAGITTDHECTTLEEAREKAALGMTIQIREGSASRNLEALLPLSKEQDCMLVSDDRHPEDLMEGHMDATLRKAVELGADPVDAVRMATLVPARHYGLGSGVIREGLSADIVVMDDIERFQAREVFIDGVQAASDGVCLFGPKPLSTGSTFSLPEIGPESLEVRAAGQTATVRVIDAFGDQIFTREAFASLRAERGALQADPDQDVLHLAVVERYGHGNVGKGFVRGFGLKAGALASSVAHDSHNIITVGVDTVNMARAVNAVAEGGGIVAVDRDGMTRLPLPIAGLMSDEPADIVVGKLGRVHTHAKRLGCGFDSPFMTLSFLALLVIPELKLSDKGLFDSRSFGFVPVMKED